MKHNGWRKPTPGLDAAEQHAQAGERLSIPKNRAMLAVKRVAAAVGLKAGDILLLDTLIAFTQAQDWEEGKRPLIWASNEYLMEQTGFSLSSLKRHARGLAELGLIAFKDSPNGKRWGHRDDQGYITEAYGFDLAPLAARCQEFEDLFERLRSERALCQNVKRKITIARRIIRAKLETAVAMSLKGDWQELWNGYQRLLDMLPKRKETTNRLLDLFDCFSVLKEKVEAAFAAAQEWRQNTQEDELSSKNMDPRGFDNEPHILVTKQPHPVSCNNIENSKKKSDQKIKQLRVVVDNTELEDLEGIEWSSGGQSGMQTEVTIETVMASCPDFAETARGMNGHIGNWNEIHRAAGQIRSMAGISADAWNVAQKKLGPALAAAAMALIYDKHCNGELASPGGYLRGMVEKAVAGELHLDRSFYGRLKERGSVH